MEEMVVVANKTDAPVTSFQGCKSELAKRIRRILENNVDLEEWNSDYTEHEEFFGDRLQFIDFSLKAKGWFGVISLVADKFENQYLNRVGPVMELEILKVVSSYDLLVPKKYWKKLITHVNRLNGELPSAYCSFFYQSPDNGQICLISQFIKAGRISDQEIAYLLSAHRTISHEFCPGINRLVEGDLCHNTH